MFSMKYFNNQIFIAMESNMKTKKEMAELIEKAENALLVYMDDCGDYHMVAHVNAEDALFDMAGVVSARLRTAAEGFLG